MLYNWGCVEIEGGKIYARRIIFNETKFIDTKSDYFVLLIEF